MSIGDQLKRVPGAVWAFLAVLVIIAFIAWLGYDYWSTPP
jgi:predicted negative regulator of RcsB-dependent stress response